MKWAACLRWDLTCELHDVKRVTLNWLYDPLFTLEIESFEFAPRKRNRAEAAMSVVMVDRKEVLYVRNHPAIQSEPGREGASCDWPSTGVEAAEKV